VDVRCPRGSRPYFRTEYVLIRCDAEALRMEELEETSDALD
jgi:hypothetical protein